MSSHVHEAIRQARLGAGLSLRTLAGTLDVSPATMSAIETGKTRISVDRVHKIAEALDVDVRTLIGYARRTVPTVPGPRRVDLSVASTGSMPTRRSSPLAFSSASRVRLSSVISTKVITAPSITLSSVR